jgi:tRNA G18 (ribose-2'-O)-methylase SpoU
VDELNNSRKLTYDEIFSKRPRLEQLKSMPRFPIYALIEDIRSMHNVGSIFRSSDGARLMKLFLCGFTACPPRSEIDKTALGATESVPWAYYRAPMEVIRELKARAVNIVVVEHTANSINYSEADFRFPLCLVMGNEVDGVSGEIVQQANLSIEIPMFGLKQSLNVSVAYGVVLYHVLDNYLKSMEVKS